MNAPTSARPCGDVPVRAATTYVPAWPALVMNRFDPSMTQLSPSRRATVRVPLASDPAPGSVRPYPPSTRPLAIGGRKASRCSSLPPSRTPPIASEVWAATISASDPHTRAISSTATA